MWMEIAVGSTVGVLAVFMIYGFRLIGAYNKARGERGIAPVLSESKGRKLVQLFSILLALLILQMIVFGISAEIVNDIARGQLSELIFGLVMIAVLIWNFYFLYKVYRFPAGTRKSFS